MGRTFIFGDIHGCYDDFIELTEKIGITNDDLIISVGDMVDRGTNSFEVYQYFKNKTNAIAIMGNHERKHLRGILSYSQEIVKLQFGDKYKDFIKWLESLNYYYETEEFIVVHAFFEHDKTIQEQRDDVISGTTAGSRYLDKKYGELNKEEKTGQLDKNKQQKGCQAIAEGVGNETCWSAYYQGNKSVVYGHLVFGEYPKIINNTYGIDTGCCHGGKLTALELPGYKIHQVNAKSNYWETEQTKWQIPVLECKNWNDMGFVKIKKCIDEFKHTTEPDVREYFDEMTNWLSRIDIAIDQIKTKIEQLSLELIDKYPNDFEKMVAELPYKTLVYRAKSNKLDYKYLRNALCTPNKVLKIADELQITVLPRR